MSVCLKVDAIGQGESGDNRHPQTIMRDLGLDVLRCEAVPLGDCWFFEVDCEVEDLPKLPQFVSVCDRSWFDVEPSTTTYTVYVTDDGNIYQLMMNDIREALVGVLPDDVEIDGESVSRNDIADRVVDKLEDIGKSNWCKGYEA